MPDPTITSISMETSQRRRLSAVMFTDIKGFTSLMESDEVTAVGLVKAQREIIRRQIAEHSGEERETIGDAFLVIFDSAVNATRCAIAIQHEIWNYNQEKDITKQVWVRIGIHLGDILIEDGSIFGEGVNVAARVQPLADPGGVCITKQVYDQVKHQIELTVSELTVKDLKNVTDVPTIYKIDLTTTEPEAPLTLKEKAGKFVHSPLKMSIAMSVVLLVAAALVYWFVFKVHTSYSKDMTFFRHRPHPVFNLGGSQIKKQNRYFEITSRGGKVLSYLEVTKPMVQPEDAAKLMDDKLAKQGRRDFPLHKFVYDHGKVKEEDVYDEFGSLQYRRIFENDGEVATLHDRLGFVKTFENQIASFGFKFDDRGRVIQMENRNAFGLLRNDLQNVAIYRFNYDENDLPVERSMFDSHSNPVEDRNGVSSTVTTYNDSGLAIKESFLDRYRSPRESLSGFASVERTFDDAGNPVLERYLNRSNEPVSANDGSCAKKMSYDNEGRLTQISTLSCSGSPKATEDGFATVRYEYDGNRILNEKFFDENDIATTNGKGVSAISLRYDENGRIIELVFTGPDGSPVSNRDRVHAVRYEYDGQGRPVKRTFLGLDMKPVIATMGYSELTVEYDERDLPTKRAYSDAEGILVNGSDGYAVRKNEYDQFGNLTSRAYFDKTNEPVFGRDEICHRVTMKYNEKGDMAEARCFDTESKLYPGIKNCAINAYQTDDYGKLVRIECYIAEGKLIDQPNIASILTAKYDSRGYLSEIRAYDASGEPAERYEGAAIWKRVADEFGNQMELATYDRNMHLINNPKYKAAMFKNEFDKYGHETRSLSFDQDGKPTPGIWGFADRRYTYDAMGNRTSESYFDGDGNPAKDWEDVHTKNMSYDGHGRLVQISSLGTDEEPAYDTNGVHATHYSYDQWGKPARIDYLGIDGKAVINKSIGAASEKFTNDERGNVTEITRLAPDGSVCREPNCVAVISQTFDSKGRLAKQLFKDADGKPMQNEMGAHGYTNDFDIQMRISTQHVLGPDGEESTDKDGVHEYRLFYKPDLGALWFTLFADEKGAPTRSKQGADLKFPIYDDLYLARMRARAYATTGGQIISITCIDSSGHDSSDTDCVTMERAKTEFEKIRPNLLQK